MCFKSEEGLGDLAQAELSEEAQSELMELCEQQFAQLEKVVKPWEPRNPIKSIQQFHKAVETTIFSILQLQNKIILCESDFTAIPQEQVLVVFL